MALCPTCSDFDIQSFGQAPIQTRGFRLAAVRQGASEFGCQFCRFLCGIASQLESKLAYMDKWKYQWIHLRMSEDYKPQAKTPLQPRNNRPLRFNCMHVLLAQRHALFTDSKAGQASWAQEGVECRVLADPESPGYKSGDVKGVFLGPDRSTDYHFEALGKRIVECLQHPKCNRTISGRRIDAMGAELPTRCIEVGQRFVRLKETAGATGAYIILSHRWDDATSRSSTTTNNLFQRTQRLAVHDLPKTFQDAIHVTRRLGIPYLWIDSLCIVQRGDRGQDWRCEAMKMSQYYQHSVLTVAAANASTEGFLHPSTVNFSDDLVRLPYRDRDGAWKGYFYVHQRQGYSGVTSDYMEEVLDGNLLRRGWVLQEWLLSRRIIHYTENQTFFECQSEEPVNDFNETVQPKRLAELRINRTDVAGQEQQSLHTIFAENNLMTGGMWFRIAMAYSGMQLTKPEGDRFLALSGIAKEIGAVMSSDQDVRLQDAYLAGMWLKDVQKGLLWERRDLGPLRPSHCGAPTWSWAAWLNPVHWREVETPFKSSCDLIGVLSKEEHEDISIEPSLRFNRKLYDVDNNFACLALRGSIAVVLVGRGIVSHERQRIAEYTGVPTEPMERWAAIADPERPSEHIGWADFDSSTAESLAKSRADMKAAIAFLVSVDQTESGGLQFDSISLTHDVYRVLFVTPQDSSVPNLYRRSGVGRIYRKDFFKSSTQVEIRLA